MDRGKAGGQLSQSGNQGFQIGALRKGFQKGLNFWISQRISPFFEPTWISAGENIQPGSEFRRGVRVPIGLLHVPAKICVVENRDHLSPW